MMPHQDPTLCARCERNPKLKGERFCTSCRSAYLKEMRESSYAIPLTTWQKWHGASDGLKFGH